MLTHRTTFWPLVVIHLIALGCWLIGLSGPLVPTLSILLHIALLVYGSSVPKAGFFIEQRTQGNGGSLALTYDDGPVPVHTEALLDLLKNEGVKATFFCIGARVIAHPSIAKRIVDEGHSIGVHTQHHRWWWGFMGKAGALKEIQDCVETIRATTGATPTLFRPPYGVTSPNTAKAIKASGLTPVAWDLRTFDTVAKDGNDLVERIRPQLQRSTIVLMHDPAPVALQLTKAVIRQASQNGTALVTLTP